LRASDRAVRPQPEGITDQSSGSLEELSTADRYRQSASKAKGIDRAGSTGVAI
jgi:hypothetical protein